MRHDRRRMKGKIYNSTVLALALLGALIAPQARAGSASEHEHRLKAAFLYNFVKFTDWPGEAAADSVASGIVDNNKPIEIGIIGKNPFGKSFEPLKEKLAKGRQVVVKPFKGLKKSEKSHEQIEAIRKCHILFICSSQKDQLKGITEMVKDHPVLTVADMSGFLESGGMINFIMEDKKVRFEINNAAAKRAKLRLSSKILRLAKRVVEEQRLEGGKK